MAATKKTARKGKTSKAKGNAPKAARQPTPEEAAYAGDVVVPVLEQMGFIDVSDHHGIEALGADVLFADFDRFGLKKFHAALVVTGDLSKKKKADVTELAAQIERALDASFSDPVTNQETSICDLHVMLDGAASGEDRDAILKSTSASAKQGRVFFHDAKDLEHARERSYQVTKELLAAQCHELKRNSSIAQFNMESWDGGKASLFRYHSTNTQKLIYHLVSKDDHEETRKKLEKYFLLIDSYNQASSIVLFSDSPATTTDLRMRLSQGASAVYKQSEELLGEVEALLQGSPAPKAS